MENNMPLRVGVIGVGEMGSNHARAYSTLKGVELVAVVDHDFEKASKASQLYGGKAYSKWTEIIETIDAVSIATPTTSHCDIAVPILKAGIHCLVEKPIAHTIMDCETIVKTAKNSESILMVGHIERFNPAVESLTEILKTADDHIYSIEASRKSTTSSRVEDVDVITDLMVHDIDVVLNIIKEDVEDVVARSPLGPDGKTGDFATAILTFNSGKSACLTASRVTQSHIRELQVTTNKRLFLLDYSSQDLLISHQGEIESAREQGTTKFVLDLAVEAVMIQKQEPLVRELTAFINAIKKKTSSPISGFSALKTMEVVARIQSQINSQI